MQVKAMSRNGLMLILFIASVALAEEVLSKDFLEYLAEFETDSGEWLDPEDIEMMATLSGGEADEQQGGRDNE